MLFLESVKPYSDPATHNRSFLAEVVALLVCYCFMCFSDFLADVNMKTNVGTVCCTIVTLHMAYNILKIVAAIVHKLKMKTKRFFLHKFRMAQNLIKPEATENLESKKIKHGRRRSLQIEIQESGSVEDEDGQNGGESLHSFDDSELADTLQELTQIPKLLTQNSEFDFNSSMNRLEMEMTALQRSIEKDRHRSENKGSTPTIDMLEQE